ncbi:hypothetical protein FHX80_1175 [Streptomyces brevispora]|uniref:Uncharacterized protein n=1 Tax=Streptomyces brevispora TaxID=887462 RepID=A0A561UQT6_9ACTN|nr:hypothetical protein FHX80_1175 [Streptomyces brevispora]
MCELVFDVLDPAELAFLRTVAEKIGERIARREQQARRRKNTAAKQSGRGAARSQPRCGAVCVEWPAYLLIRGLQTEHQPRLLADPVGVQLGHGIVEFAVA